MTNIVPITKPFAPDDIVAGLRKLAEQIEAGEYGLKTTCVVLVGHTEDRPGDGGDRMHCMSYEIFGYGPRCDTFTVAGLLTTAAVNHVK